jgi:hypothetical protein
MGKIVLWIAVAFVVLFALRLINAGKARRRADAARRDGTPPDVPTVRCLRCGVFLPRTDATPAPGGYTCGDPACRSRR